MEDAEERVDDNGGVHDSKFLDGEDDPQFTPPGMRGIIRRASSFLGLKEVVTFPKGDEIMKTLENAKIAGRLARLRMTLPPFIFGLLILVLSFFLFGANLLMAPATLCIAMSLLPTDQFRMKLVGCVTVLILLVQAISLSIRTWKSLEIAYGDEACLVRDEYRLETASKTNENEDTFKYEIPCATVAILSYMAFCFVIANLVAAIQIIRSARFGTRHQVELFWKTSGSFWHKYAWIISYCVVSMLSTPKLRENERSQIILLASNALVMFAVGKAFHYPKLRVTLQGFLLSKGEHTSAAAGIAGLLGSGDPYEVRKMAQSRFRAVSMDHITEDDLKDSKPNPKLYEKSVPATIGSVDCFVSHSWHDRPGLKWEKLQKWRANFKATNFGREPLLWVDKLCLNQNDIESSLKCLPVFLAGCKGLLVLGGDTYTSRLWCVMELFTFLVMGGVKENIELVVLAADDEHQAKLETDFTSFDASRASCFLPEDTEKLLGTIEGGFGGLERFSAHVNEILGELINRRGKQGSQEGSPGQRSFFRRTIAVNETGMSGSPTITSATLPRAASSTGSSNEKGHSIPRSRQTFSGTFSSSVNRVRPAISLPGDSPPV